MMERGFILQISIKASFNICMPSLISTVSLPVFRYGSWNLMVQLMIRDLCHKPGKNSICLWRETKESAVSPFLIAQTKSSSSKQSTRGFTKAFGMACHANRCQTVSQSSMWIAVTAWARGSRYAMGNCISLL